MHPAYSIIFFTTASGAGYGLLALLGLGVAAPGAILPEGRAFGLVSLGLAIGLVSAGLLSSAWHLGRPERALWAFTQWRSSWLSREAVAAASTYLPTAALAAGWVLLGRLDGWVALSGFLAATGALITVCMTAMIYASLRPIAQWHNRFTLPAYLVFSIMSGFVLLNALLWIFGVGSPWTFSLALLAILAGWLIKIAAWRSVDASAPPASANTATGLPGGTVRSLEWPHTEENYLLKEMGYRVARKHTRRLRGIVHLLAFALPSFLLALCLVLPAPAVLVASVLAAFSQLAGLLVERWLFFAEARHTVTLYYGY
ncbi:DmsC/YnfH family molybdoenzyme membrane anchor subunit [Chelativorans sp. Marseille-P2723]|uniref:dimethyl sulfoxide reductase anchor subunit family protein n=1 Tax=Chelativorans sp. Marseille-P2723 TaxID=2709133 RepID=UPI00156EA48F|nr:DmsC/YnfH family molybdoenzyme membrane anchor subunit [Chelativorans sp. Marseille-P2723]